MWPMLPPKHFPEGVLLKKRGVIEVPLIRVKDIHRIAGDLAEKPNGQRQMRAGHKKPWAYTARRLTAAGECSGRVQAANDTTGWRLNGAARPQDWIGATEPGKLSGKPASLDRRCDRCIA